MPKKRNDRVALVVLTGFAAAAAFAQGPPPGYPPQQYPAQQQYPQQQQYPAQQYPPQQQGPPQQYPAQQQYPQQQQYPAQQYPPQQYPPQQQGPPPSFPAQQLDQLVARVALYPDPLLAQVMAAATYPNDIPAAAQWADQHHYLSGQALADAIQGDQLPWDPSVQALLPFPSVLDMMNSDMHWTSDLGNAFLAQEQDVMDAVQRQRQVAQRYGYLRSNGEVSVSDGPYIDIEPANPGYVVVPYYDPTVVFYPPRPGFYVGGGIRFGYGVSLGGYFSPWGWAPGRARFDWGGHGVFLNGGRWDRRWDNRAAYVHSYPEVRRSTSGFNRRPEPHALEPRSMPERNAPRQGRPEPRETHRPDRRGGDRGGDRGGKDR